MKNIRFCGFTERVSDDSAADSHTVCFRGADWQIEAGKSAKSQTQSLQYEAQEWGLSAEEYARFEALMKGVARYSVSGLDPLTTLGIEARSDEERCRLAEKWVQQEFTWAEKSWRFSGKWMQPRNGFMVRYYRSVWEQPAESGLYSFI